MDSTDITETTTTALLDVILTRAAEQYEDLVEPAMQLYYSRHPGARAAFVQHGLDDPERLEAEMVTDSLECLIAWGGSPHAAEVILASSVPHHVETLDVIPEWYAGLLGSVIDVIADTIPEEHTDEHALVERARSSLLAAIDSARPH